MANRYWVGGNGTWNTTSTTNWSASSGGSSGASVPNIGDSVFFDQAGTYTVTMTGGLACLDFNVTNGTVTFQNGTTPTLSVDGNWSTKTGTVWNTTGVITFSGISKTITSNGVTINSPCVFTGAGSIRTLQDNLTTTTNITLDAGTLSLNNFTLSSSGFTSTGSVARVLSFGTSGQLTVTGGSGTILACANMTNFTYTGTPRIYSSYNGSVGTRTFLLGTTAGVSPTNTFSISFGTSGTGLVIAPATDTVSLQGTYFNADFTNLTNTVSNDTRSFYGNLTVPASGGTFTAGANVTNIVAGIAVNINVQRTLDFPFTINSVGGTLNFQNNFTIGSTRTFTLTAGTLALSTFTLSVGLFNASGSTARTINFGTGKIVLTSATTSTVWTTATVTNLTVSGTPLVECQGGGTAVTKTINTGALSEANAISFSLLETTGTATYAFTASNVVKNLITNGVQTVSNIAITIYGSFTHQTTNGTTTFSAGTNAWTFAATSGSYTITNIAGFTYDFPWTFGSATSTATWTLAANLTLGATRQLTLTNGTTDFNSKTISAAGITIVTGTPSIANTGTASFTTTLPITHTSGTLTLPFNFTTSSASGYTFTAGTLALGTYILTTPLFSSSNSNARTLNFGTGKIVLNGSVTATIWTTSTATNFTVSGTPLVECIGGGTSVTKTITAGSPTEANTVSFSLLETTGSVTYTITANGRIKNFVVNGAQTLSNTGFEIYGSFTHLTTNGTTTFTAGANAFTFGASSGSYTITNIAGFTYDFPWQIGLSGSDSTATWTLAANLTLGATRVLTLSSGTFDFNSKTFSGSSVTLNGRSPTIANTGGGGFLSLTVPFTVNTNYTMSINITTSGQLTHSAGTFSLSNQSFTCLNFVGSGTSTLAFGASGQIVITGNNTTVISCSGSSWTVTGNAYFNLSYTGSTGTRVINFGNLPEASAVLLNLCTSGTSGVVINPSATDTISLQNKIGDVNLTGFIGTLIWSGINSPVIYGNIVTPLTGGTYTGSAQWQLARSTGTQTITTNGRTIPITFYFDGNTVQLLDNLSLSQDNFVWHRTGNFNLNNYTYTANTFKGDGASTRVIQFGNSGQININGNNRTVLDFTDTANLSFTGNVYFNLSYTGSTGNRTIIIDEGTFVTNSMTRAENEKLKFAASGTTGIVVNSAATDTLILNCRLGDANFVGFSGNANGSPTFIGNLNLASSGGNYNLGLSEFDSDTGNKTITSNGRTVNGEYRFYANTGNWIFNDSATLTGPLTIWAGRVYLNNFTHNIDYFEVSNNGNNQVLDFGTSSQLNCTDGGSVGSYILNITNSTNLSYVGTPKFYATYSGNSGYRQIFYSPSNVTPKSKCLDISFGTSGNGIVIANSSDSIRYGGYFNNINYNGSNNSNDGTTNDIAYIYGNLTYTSNTGNTGTGGQGYTFITEAGSTSYIDCTRPINRDINIQADGNVVLQNSFSVPYGIFSLTKGNLNLNNYNIITTQIRSNTGNSRTINFANSSTITLADNNTVVLDCNNASNLTFTGTPKIYSNYTGATGTRTFDIGSTSGATANNILSVTMLPSTTGGSGQGVSGDDGGGYGGGIGGGTGTIDLNGGGTGGVAQNVDGLSTAVTGAGYTFGSGAGVGGGTGTTPANQKNGTSATGFGAGGGGAGYYGGNGGNGYLGGGGGGAAGYTQTNMAGGSGGNGAVVLQMTVNGSPTYVVLTSGTTYNTPAGTTSVKIWAVGAGGGGAGSTNSDSGCGGGGGAGGVAILTSTATGTITYSIGTGGAGGIDANAGSSGGNTTATFDGNTITAYGGGGGGYNNNTGGIGGAGSIAGNFNGIILTQGATDTIGLRGNFKDIDLSGFTMTLNNNPINVWGNYTIPATGGTLQNGPHNTTFMGSNTQTVTTNGRTLDFPITIGNGTSNGNVRLGSALTLGSTRTFTLTSGKFDLNDFTATANLLVANGTNIRSFDFANTGQFTLVGSNTTVISMPTMVNFNTNGNARFNSTYTGATGTRTFAMGNTAGAYALNVFDVSVTDTKGIVLGNTATDSVALVGYYRNANFTGLTNTIVHNARTFYGNFITPTTGGTITAGTSATTLSAPIVTPGSNEYSVYFDGNSDWIQIAGNSAFAIATSTTPFTIECWVHPTALGGAIFTDSYTGTGDPIGITISMSDGVGANFTNGLTIAFGAYSGSAWSTAAMANTPILLNAWTHVACVFTGSTTKIFLNGIDSTSAGALSTWPVTGNNGQNWYIGRRWDNNPTTYFTGYISNFRFVNGTAIYTSNFTPPTSPLTAISNTKLLTCQNNTYIDNSTNNFSINVAGPTGIALQSPFVAFSPVVKTITTNNRTLDFPIIIGDGEGGGINQLSGNLTLGSTRGLTLNYGTLDLNNYTLSANTFLSNLIASRTIAFANTGQISLSATAVTVWNSNLGNALSWTGNLQVNSTYTGNAGTRVFDFGDMTESYAPNVKIALNTTGFNIGTANDSVTLSGSIGSLNLTSLAATVTNTVRTVYGNLTLPASGGTLTAGANTTTFAASNSNITFTTNGRTLDFPITINGINSNFTLNTAVTIGSTRLLTLSNGSLQLNNLTLSTGTFAAGTGTKNIKFDGGTLTVVGSGATAFNISNATNFTTTKGNGNGTISMTSATAKTFAGNSSVYNCALDNAGSANLTVTGNNTFEVIKSTYASSTANTYILIPNAGDTTVTTGVGSGTASNKLFGIAGETTGSRANLIYTGSGNIVTNYINTRDVSYISNTWAETSNGSQPWRWYLGTSSVNQDDVNGAIFQDNDNVTGPIFYHITSGSSFTIPSNWDSANNTIHIWGGGGGSAGSKTPAGGAGNIIGSSGGGGGGYTKVINFTANPGNIISFSIGAGGTAGVANTSNGGNGGTTTFSSYSANGGKGSTITATGTTPGQGGIGGTYNGGNGGFGAFTTNAANNSAGGGGGGAGGPYGNGGIGGNASPNNGTSTSTSGGGGGSAGGGTNGSAGSGATGGAGGASFIINGRYGYGGNGGSSGGAGSAAAFSTDILNSKGGGAGSGGGGAIGQGGTVGGNTLGGGAGGSGANDAGTTIAGVDGGTGGIIIVYYACTSPVFNSASSMFLVF